MVGACLNSACLLFLRCLDYYEIVDEKEVLIFELLTSIIKYIFELFVGFVFIFDVIKLIQIKEAKSGPLNKSQKVKLFLLILLFLM